MRVDGERIKATRKAMRLTQEKVARGICTQTTISNIERKHTCDKMEILKELCMRLNLPVDECIQKEAKEIEMKLEHVAILCNQERYREAYELFVDSKTEIIIFDQVLKTKYFYYQGIVHLYGENAFQKALLFFKEGAKINEKNIYTSFCLKNIGKMYVQKLDSSEAYTYYQQALEVAEEQSLLYPREQCEVYYDCACFFSSIGAYSNALNACRLGLTINAHLETTYLLASLLYEQAKGLEKVGMCPIEEYHEAYYIARHLKDFELAKEIKLSMDSWSLSMNVNS